MFGMRRLLFGLLGSTSAERSVDSLIAEQIGKGFLGSPDNQVALRGLKHAIQNGSLYDGTLRGMDFDEADLTNAPLRHAYLVNVSLRYAILRDADLRDVIFHGADLRGATLTRARFNRKTMLPDGSYWQPGTQLDRFTDQAHPDFFDLDQT